MGQLKTTRKALAEMNESYIELLRETKVTSRSFQAAKQLWRAGYKSRLIKIGMALIVIPEPTPDKSNRGRLFRSSRRYSKSSQKPRSLHGRREENFPEHTKRDFSNYTKPLVLNKTKQTSLSASQSHNQQAEERCPCQHSCLDWGL